MRQLLSFGVIATMLACCGCDAKSKRAVIQEVARHSYVEGVGPLVVASVVAASALSGGMGPLNGVCVDRAWRAVMGKFNPAFENAPSMFEIPDPNRPIQITTSPSRVGE